jgi:hypothetical protein
MVTVFSILLNRVKVIFPAAATQLTGADELEIIPLTAPQLVA